MAKRTVRAVFEFEIADLEYETRETLAADIGDEEHELPRLADTSNEEILRLVEGIADVDVEESLFMGSDVFVCFNKVTFIKVLDE